jgi:hypothetical protein
MVIENLNLTIVVDKPGTPGRQGKRFVTAGYFLGAGTGTTGGTGETPKAIF